MHEIGVVLKWQKISHGFSDNLIPTLACMISSGLVLDMFLVITVDCLFASIGRSTSGLRIRLLGLLAWKLKIIAIFHSFTKKMLLYGKRGRIHFCGSTLYCSFLHH